MSSKSNSFDIRALSRSDLAAFVKENVRTLLEDEALAVIDNLNVTPAILQAIAHNARLTGFYQVRLRLVAHRQTPQAHATKFVHYLFFSDLIRLSVDVKVPSPVRRAIDTILVNRIDKLSLGERIASARRCSQALIKVLLFDPDPKVFEGLLVNQRIREDDLLIVAHSDKASPEQLRMLAYDYKWSHRYAIRKALVMNPLTPRSAAASQLKFLTWRDLRMIHKHPATSTYLRRCIERLEVIAAESDRPPRREMRSEE
jgi:hypothetical protein